MTDKESIKVVTYKFYQDLYGKLNIDSAKLKTYLKLLKSRPWWLIMRAPFGADDLINTLAVCNNSSPGPDGISYAMYYRLWDVMGGYVTHYFNWLYFNGLIPDDWKVGIVVTIPKKDQDPSFLSNRRPITLLNTLYKWFAKAFTYFLMSVISPIIANTQNGFINGSRLQINSSVVDEALKNMFLDQVAGQTINLYDFHKAFDSVSHASVTEIFSHLVSSDPKRLCQVRQTPPGSDRRGNRSTTESLQMLFTGLQQPRSPVCCSLQIFDLEGVVNVHQRYWQHLTWESRKFAPVGAPPDLAKVLCSHHRPRTGDLFVAFSCCLGSS